MQTLTFFSPTVIEMKLFGFLFCGFFFVFWVFLAEMDSLGCKPIFESNRAVHMSRQ